MLIAANEVKKKVKECLYRREMRRETKGILGMQRNLQSGHYNLSGCCAVTAGSAAKLGNSVFSSSVFSIILFSLLINYSTKVN